MKQELEYQRMPTSSSFSAQDELGLEVFKQLMDRLSNLEEKYGEAAITRGVEMLNEEVEKH